jgi:hypothetical protein
MIYLIFLIFLIILIFLLFDKCFDKCNESFSTFTNRKFFSQKQPIEITTLPLCNKIFKVDYTLNTNTVNNDDKGVSQDIAEPMIQTVEIGGVDYNLSKVEWKTSPFSWKDKQVGIDLHLIHTNYKSMTTVTILIPLDLLSASIIANSSEAVKLPQSSSLNPINSLETNSSSNSIKSEEKSENVNSSNPINSTSIIDLSNTTKILKPTLVFNFDDPIKTVKILEDFKDINYNKMDESFSIVESITGVDENIYATLTNETDKAKYFNLDHTLADIRNSFADIGTLNGNTLIDIGKFNLQIEYSRNYDINKHSVNKLLDSFTQIPNYQCCSKVIGPLIGINLCPLKKIIESNPQFYILEQENGNVIFITQPSPFNETIGLYLRDSVKQDMSVKYLIPNQK